LRRRRAVFSAAVVAAGLAANFAKAGTYTWTGNADELFGNPANWVSRNAASSSPDTTIVFDATGVDGTTILDDRNISFELNNFTFNSAAPSLVNENLYPGTPFDFATSSASVAPTINQSSASSQTIEEPLVLTNTLTFQGNGTGGVSLTGQLTGPGGLNDNSSSSPLNLSGGTGANPGSIQFLAVNNGTTTMSGGVLNLSAPDSTGFTGHSSIFVEGNATFNLSGGATLNTVGTPQVHNNGVFNLTSATWTNANAVSGANEVRIGYAGGTSKLNITSGTLNTGALRLGHSDFSQNPGHAAMIVSGGTVTTNTLILDDSASTIALDQGSQLSVGTLSTLFGGSKIGIGNGSVFSVGTLNASGSYSAILSDLAVQTTKGTFRKVGSGTLLIQDQSSAFSGTVDLRGGAVGFGNGSAVGTGTILGNGGSIWASDGSRSFSNPIAISSGSFLGAIALAGDVNPLTITGPISGGGSLLVNAAGATVTLGSTQSSTFGGGLVSAGALVQTAGTVNMTGGFTQNSGASLTISGGQMNFGEATSGGGTLGGTTIINSGATLGSNGGSIQVTGTILNNGKQTGSINIGSQGFATGAGTFGTLNVNGGGTLSPGTTIGTFSTASITVTNGLSLGTSSTYVEDILPAGSVDHLSVLNGSVTLGGTLQLSLHNGVVPTLANYTPIISSNPNIAMTGTFAQVTGQEIDATDWLAILYHPHDMGYSLTFPGDASLDGVVNTTDFTILAAHFGQMGQTWPTGDFNGDGVVNALDFSALASHFGASADNAPPLGSVLPEPAIPFAILLCCNLSRRRRNATKR
jgi:hypothetical protein